MLVKSPGMSLFGTKLREDCLVAVNKLIESNVPELSKITGGSKTAIKNIVTGLEEVGVLVSRFIGRSKVYRINDRYPNVEELKALLHSIGMNRPEFLKQLGSLKLSPNSPA